MLELGKQVGLDKQFCLSQIKLTENVLKNARKYFVDAHVGKDRIDKMMQHLRVNFNKNTLKPLFISTSYNNDMKCFSYV